MTSSSSGPTRGGFARLRSARSGCTTPETPRRPFHSGSARPRREPPSSPKRSGALRGARRPAGRRRRRGARRMVRRRAGVSRRGGRAGGGLPGRGPGGTGRLPTRRRIVIERCFDESEGTQLIVHAPYGGRVNRALGLALRKRFCVSFDFELQAAADDDTVRALARAPAQLPPDPSAAGCCRAAPSRRPDPGRAAPSDAPARWRWNCNRALVVPRSRGGQRRPIHLQRMEADDLLAAAWPALAACQENAAAGPVAVPDHVLARQTVADCLTEALEPAGWSDWCGDRGGAGRGARRGVAGAVAARPRHPHRASLHVPRRRAARGAADRGRCRCAGASGGRARRSAGARRRAGAARRSAVATVLDQVRPRPRDADELHDLLLSLVRAGRCRRGGEWFDAAGGRRPGGRRWTATGRQPNAGRWRRPRRPTTRRRPSASRVTWTWPGRCGGRAGGADALSRRAPLGCSAEACPGAHGAGPAGGRGLGHRAARRSVVRPPPAGAPARRQPQPGAGGTSSRPDRRAGALPRPLAARGPGSRLEGRPGCSR